MASGGRPPTVPEQVAPIIEAAQHCCKHASMQGGSDFSVALLVRRGSSTPLIVYATGLTSEAENGTRKALKAAAMLFFRSPPVAPSPQAAVQRDLSTGLVWGGASAVGGMMRNPMSSAGSTLQLPGKPGESPGSTASVVPATGGGSGGGGGGVGGGGGDQSCSQGAVSAAGAAQDSVEAATTPPPGVVASDEATATYGRLPDLPQIIGTAAVTGERALGAEATSLSSPLPGVTPREFDVTPAMAEGMGKKFSDGNLSITREHMSGIMALLKYLYDIRLPRFGTTTPYEPLFPVVARGVIVDFEAVDATHHGKIQLDLKNVSSQKKYTTFALLLFMIYYQNDSAYEWIVDRYCGGMRASTKSNTAGKARRSSKSKTKTAGAIAAAAAAQPTTWLLPALPLQPPPQLHRQARPLQQPLLVEMRHRVRGVPVMWLSLSTTNCRRLERTCMWGSREWAVPKCTWSSTSTTAIVYLRAMCRPSCRPLSLRPLTFCSSMGRTARSV